MTGRVVIDSRIPDGYVIEIGRSRTSYRNRESHTQFRVLAPSPSGQMNGVYSGPDQERAIARAVRHHREDLGH